MASESSAVAGSRSAALDAACILLAVAPLLALAARGALSVPLWMDEVNYLVYALAPETREAAPGQPVTALQGAAYCLFSYPNLMRPYLRLAEAAGAAPWRDPEVPIRVPSLLFALTAGGLTYALARRHGRLVATLAAAALAAMPLFQYYAFEARVYALGAAAGLLYLWLARGLGAHAGTRLLATGALGAALPWISIWSAPWLAGPPTLWLVGRLWPVAIPRRLGLRTMLAATLPGVVVTLLQIGFLAGPFSYQRDMRYSELIGFEVLPRLIRELWSGPGYLGASPPLSFWMTAAGVVALGMALLVVGLATGRLPPERRDVAILWLASVAAVAVLGGAVRGFVSGRYEVPVIFGLLAALAQLPRRAAVPLLAALLVLGLAATPWTAARIELKSSTRPMVAHVRREGHPAREGVLVRHQLSWDPLHRYTGWLYLELADGRWRARTYPRLERLGDDFMLFDTVVDSPASRQLLRSTDDPRVVDWVREQRFEGVWVLAPDSLDHRELDTLLGEAGLRLRKRFHYAGYPDSWLLHYRRGAAAG